MFTITKNARNLSMVLMAIGLIALIFGFITDYRHSLEDSHYHSSTWPALLFNNYFFLGISVFAVFFIGLQYVSEAAWSIVLKRIPEAVISFLPITGLIMLIIMVSGAMHFGGNHIYHWMAEGIMDPDNVKGMEGAHKPYYDDIIAGKEAFLNTTFFLLRSVIYILGWIYFGRKLKKYHYQKINMEDFLIIIKE